MEPHLIGAALGHTDSRMVERVYGRLPAESLALALRWRVDGEHPAAGCRARHDARSARYTTLHGTESV